MEMAKYILSILRMGKNKVIIWSWGFHQPVALENGIRFKVNGFKFKGIVSIVYNEGRDLFDVSFIKRNRVVNTIDGVYFDMLVETIDDFVEKTSDYDQRVIVEYSIKVY